MGFTEAVTVGSHLYSLYWVQKPCESFEAFDEDGGKRGCTVFYIKAERAVVPRAPGVATLFLPGFSLVFFEPSLCRL